jgi:hypothetical protein
MCGVKVYDTYGVVVGGVAMIGFLNCSEMAVGFA